MSVNCPIIIKQTNGGSKILLISALKCRLKSTQVAAWNEMGGKKTTGSEFTFQISLPLSIKSTFSKISIPFTFLSRQTVLTQERESSDLSSYHRIPNIENLRFGSGIFPSDLNIPLMFVCLILRILFCFVLFFCLFLNRFVLLVQSCLLLYIFEEKVVDCLWICQMVATQISCR